MKKFLSLLVVTCTCFLLSFAFSACDETLYEDSNKDYIAPITSSQNTTGQKEETPVTTSKPANSISPEFKAAMDSYEAFFDKYCAFMKKYKESTNPLALMNDYLDFMSRYTDAMNKPNEIGDEELNDAELLYYTEVMLRINQKIHEVSSFSQPQMNGFDSTTNEVYAFSNYTIEIPNYWKYKQDVSNGIRRYAETGGKAAMLNISASDAIGDYPVTFYALLADNDNMLEMMEETVFEKVTGYEVIDTGTIKGIMYDGIIFLEDSGLLGRGKMFVFASAADRNWCFIFLMQTDNTEHQYTDDFIKMIHSISVKNNDSSNNDSNSDELANGMRPEFKAAMDSYEAFFDEYCAFMKKYKESTNPLGMMNDYLDFMSRYTDAMNKLNEIDDEDLNEAELLYYTEVMLRINQKILEAAQ